jgi:hypothetical protein
MTCLYGGKCNQTIDGGQCVCPTGKTGRNCETEINNCSTIKCKNDGQCVSSFGNWSCQCIDKSLFTGTYCENKASTLVVKELTSRSFAGVAIGCLSTVVSFILILDILKYCFHIDPLLEERQNEMRRQQTEGMKQRPNQQQPTLAVRFQYIHE